MPKKKVLIFFPIVVLIIIALLCVNSRYYSSEIEAYNALNSADNIITEKISSVRYDDVEVFLGKTSENEYIVTPFIVKNDKYKSKSDFYICDMTALENTGNDSYIINSKRYYYNIVKEEFFEEQNDEIIKTEKFSLDGNDYIFRICKKEVSNTDFEFENTVDGKLK